MICSRITWLIRSIFTCIDRKRGTAFQSMKPTIAARSGMTTISSPERVTSVRSAMNTPPTNMIGALTIKVSAICMKSWICCTSFVLRVISEAVPKRFISRAEKPWTRPNTAARRSRPTPIEAREAQYTPAIAITPSTSVMPSITVPVRQMWGMSPLATPLLMMSALRLGR